LTLRAIEFSVKDQLRTLFSPILAPFEKDEGEYVYKSSHRTILLVVGALFLLLSSSAIGAAIAFGQFGAALPGLIFFTVCLYCFVVGGLGSDRAVAKIWKSR